jgi:hypothetical protein
VSLPYHGSMGLLNFLIDSTGIKAEGEGEWNAHKHGGAKRRIWRKIHIGVDEETLEVRAVEVTSCNIGDAPIMPELLNHISADRDIGSVIADGAYDTRKCHEAIAARNAHAVIHPRKNAKPWKPASTASIARNDAVRGVAISGQYPVATLERISPPKPSQTKMHCMKLLGQSLMARDFERQVSEIQTRIAVLNHHTVLGTPVTEPLD